MLNWIKSIFRPRYRVVCMNGSFWAQCRNNIFSRWGFVAIFFKTQQEAEEWIKKWEDV